MLFHYVHLLPLYRHACTPYELSALAPSHKFGVQSLPPFPPCRSCLAHAVLPASVPPVSASLYFAPCLDPPSTAMAPKASRPVEGQEPHSAPLPNPLPTGQPHDPHVQREVLRRRLEARYPGRTAESATSQAPTLTAEPTASQTTPRGTRPRWEVSVDASDSDPEGPPPKRPTAPRPPPLQPAPEDAEMAEAAEAEASCRRPAAASP